MSSNREETRAAIIALHLKGKRNVEIVRSLGVSKQLVSKAVNRYKEQGNNKDRQRSGRPRTANTPKHRKIIRERIRRNFRRSMRKIASDIGISPRTVGRICKSELGCKSLKLQKGQHMTDKVAEVRKKRCQALRRRHGANRHRKILFSDEKFFNIEQAHNIQNDRVLVPSSSVANRRGRSISRTQKPAGLMVWAGVSTTGKTPLVFVQKGVKINADNYLQDILQAVVLPWARAHYSNERWTFQQDSAPAHRAKTVQDWCKKNFPSFISAAEWPPYSPDLNPLDYAIWGILEAKACAHAHKTVDDLKRSLEHAWDEIGPDVLRASVDQFPKRLRACIRKNGGYIEKEDL